MLSNITNFCTTIIFTTLTIIILEMVMPEGKSKKYVSFVCKVVITIALINPILSFMNVDIGEKLELTDSNYNQYRFENNTYEKSVRETYEKNLVNDITSRLEESGYIVCNVQVEYNEETFKPTKIYMSLETNDGYIQEVKVDVFAEKSKGRLTDVISQNKIKEILHDNYGIAKENIYIE